MTTETIIIENNIEENENVIFTEELNERLDDTNKETIKFIISMKLFIINIVNNDEITNVAIPFTNELEENIKFSLSLIINKKFKKFIIFKKITLTPFIFRYIKLLKALTEEALTDKTKNVVEVLERHLKTTYKNILYYERCVLIIMLNDKSIKNYEKYVKEIIPDPPMCN